MGLVSQMTNNIDPKNRRDKDGPIKETAHSRNQKVYKPYFLSSRSQFAIPKLSSMADESSSTTSRPNDDRSTIVFGGFTRCKQPSVRDDGATVSQIEWFSIDVPDADSHCQKQKLNPYCVTIVVSKISNMDPDKEGFKDLNISVVATHKYPMDRSIDILDAQLL